MERLFLRKVTLSDKIDFTDFLKELVTLSGALKGVYFQDGLSFEELLLLYEKKEKIPFSNYNQLEYPFHQFLLMREYDNKIVGAVNIRPFLTRELNENFEGNIGYSISPSERGKGYGSIALGLAIEEFKKLNPNDKIVICCFKENTPSKNIIQKFGGKLIEELEGVLTPQKYVIEK